MSKMACVVLGIALAAIGILGVIDFSIDMQYVQYVYYGAIALGIVGFLIGIYAKQGTSDQRLKTETATQKRDIEHQKKEIDQQNKLIETQKKELETENKQVEIHRKEVDDLKREIDELKFKVKGLESSV